MINIALGIKEEQRDEVAKLFLDAFWDKLSGTLKDKQKGFNLIKNSLNDSIFVATEEEKVLGFLSFNSFETGPCFNPKRDEIKKYYGKFEWIIVYWKLLLFGHQSVKEELYIEFISVSKDSQNKGIGKKMMDELYKYSNGNNIKYLTLLVVETNPLAKKLYENLGFYEVGVWKTWWFKRVLKLEYNAIFSMRKDLKKAT